MAGRSHAVELADGLEFNGVVAVAVQCQQVSGAEDKCRSPAPLQPELNFSANERNHLHVKLGFASGNGLNNNLPVNLSAWAADLEDDIKDINGRDRSHLLTAWYRHDFRVAGASEIQLTMGIIDATDYLDHNRYSNDEYSQFMNAALVNAPSTWLPSYDAGAAIEWDSGDWSLRGVAMNVGSDGPGGSYDFSACRWAAGSTAAWVRATIGRSWRQLRMICLSRVETETREGNRSSCPSTSS